MATDDAEAKASDRDESNDSDSSSDSDGESGQTSPVEWLATSRAKRSTAGNRMKSMLANEEPAADDSDLELLFAEDADDDGFSGNDREDASDVQMNSSSDDEDDAAGKDDDLEGEKELERREREKKTAARKRKAQEAIPARFRKKVRIDPPASASAAAEAAAAAPRPKKKSERLSWLPLPSDAPTRASQRATTRSSKEQLHQQMIERERRRMRQMEVMEKKAKKAAAMKKPPMTQAQRLAEAAVVEKKNAKSLNRWEEAERLREEERQAKLAAMYNRTLEGPVVTFWSGILELSEGQMKHVGRMVTMEEKAPRKKRQSAAAATLAATEAEDAKPDGAPVPNDAPEASAAPNAEPAVEPAAPAEPAEPSPVPHDSPAPQGAATLAPPPAAPPRSEEPKSGLAAPYLPVTHAVFVPVGPPLSMSPPPAPEAKPPPPPPPPPFECAGFSRRRLQRAGPAGRCDPRHARCAQGPPSAPRSWASSHLPTCLMARLLYRCPPRLRRIPLPPDCMAPPPPPAAAAVAGTTFSTVPSQADQAGTPPNGPCKGARDPRAAQGARHAARRADHAQLHHPAEL